MRIRIILWVPFISRSLTLIKCFLRTNAGTEGGVYTRSGPSGPRAALVQFGYDGSSSAAAQRAASNATAVGVVGFN